MNDNSRSFNLNNFETDYKASVLAAELVESGFSPEDIFIWPSGNSRRNFAKDVLSVEWFTPEGSGKQMLCIRSSREGLYDMLPEGLFHQPVPYSSTRTTDEIIGQIRRHKQEEKEARKFFLPLEAEINLFRILIELRENKIDKKSIYDDLIRIFHSAWEIFPLLDQQQANIFLHMIPYLNETKGVMEKLASITELLLQMPVSVTVGTPLHNMTGTPLNGNRAGDCTLGVDMICGDSFAEGDGEVVIAAGPVSSKQALQLLPGARLEKILRWLVAYFVPAALDVRLDILLKEEEKTMVLGGEGALGYVMHLA
ncbi:type VI secretion system baseplate subunit TssG [Chitinophaga sp. GCM10012297]|uniref:Type VI secretion system baseplate subunit TssG n=1 Tax=Chitinophaga chungangae TaxID=2821488 RepID=A0ABS3YH87_9BACT|nr:type VI secretion system baseplate subunit TssG [Chitinophaga chungangae]MBO9153805.1 type VI secretion system baseplate subunit TssG [Chitinophaga chungangae]